MKTRVLGGLLLALLRGVLRVLLRWLLRGLLPGTRARAHAHARVNLKNLWVYGGYWQNLRKVWHLINP